MSNSPSTPALTAVKHRSAPQWGNGLLVKEYEDKRFYEFEDGQNHVIGRAFWDHLEAVSLSPAELEALEHKLLKGRVRVAPTKKAPAKRAPKLPTTTFAAQLASFTGEFAGGFLGQDWLARERGEANQPKGKAFKNHAIACAQRELAQQTLQALLSARDYAGVMTRVQTVHKAAGNLLHPLGDLIPFSKMPVERHQAFAEALFELLYGAADFAPRFDAYVAVLAQDKLATWPLVSVLPALVDPASFVFVKPTAFEMQAAVLSFALGYQRQPTAEGYARMCQMARELSKQLAAAGSAPKDLLDVYAFIARANAKPKAPKAPKAAPAATPIRR